MLVWAVSPSCRNSEGETGDQQQEQDDRHDDDQHGVQVERGGQVSLVGALQLAREHGELALARGCVEVVASLAEAAVPARALAGLTVPPVEAAVVAAQFLTGQAGQALARARVCQELLALLAGRGVEQTLTTTRTPVVLKLYACAVWSAVHVDDDGVGLKARSLGCARRAKAGQAETWKKK